MTPSAKILELLLQSDKMTTRQITDRLGAQRYAWPSRTGQHDVTFDRVHNKLIGMLLKGQVKRKKSMGVWIWSLP